MKSARCPVAKASEYKKKGGRPYCTPTSATGRHKTACGYPKRVLLFVVVVVVVVVPSAVVPGTVYATLKSSPPHFPHPWPALWKGIAEVSHETEVACTTIHLRFKVHVK